MGGEVESVCGMEGTPTSANSRLPTIAVHSANESWSRFTLWSSASCSSKQEMGTRKMIAVRSSKKGSQAWRWLGLRGTRLFESGGGMG